MYETVKVVKGYAITRMVGTQRFYIVQINSYKSVDFRTIKAAVEYINNYL